MGKLFVIDGTDGSGKQTQFEKLKENLTKRNIDYLTVSFPNYDSPSSSLVKMYLSGEFGEDAKLLDRFEYAALFVNKNLTGLNFNNGIINNMPGNTETGNTNTNNGNVSYGPSNNTGTNYGSSYGNSKPTIVPSPGTGNNNAATTTPSAPDSDAGIIDNSGETLDVISIDKDSSKVQPSTSSSDGGSVIPVILGVGAAGAAAVAGAKFIHDKKERENTYTYEDDSSAENTNYSYNSNIDEQESSEDPYDAVMQPNAKYKAGNVNKLVLDDAPADINIRSDIPDNNSKEELE